MSSFSARAHQKLKSIRANINPYRLGFWMLSYILFDRDLLSRLKAETRTAYHNGQIDPDLLLHNCPLLESTYHESLRFLNTALSARRIVAPTTIGRKILASGNTIVIPFQKLHHDPEVFGEDAGCFSAERFLRNEGLANSKSYRPFGGGTSYCPGRFFARQEMLVFIALVLNRFDIKLAEGLKQEFPEYDSSTPALGINGPARGMDLLVDIEEACGA